MDGGREKRTRRVMVVAAQHKQQEEIEGQILRGKKESKIYSRKKTTRERVTGPVTMTLLFSTFLCVQLLSTALCVHRGEREERTS